MIQTAIDVSPQAASNRLQPIADHHIVESRRVGQRVLYRIVDPCVPSLMDLGVCFLEQRG